MKIENRTFIISGGSSGLGLATALKLHENGAHVAIIDLQEVPESAKESMNDRSRYFKTDLTNDSQIESAVNEVVKWTKNTNAPLGGVVNCGGVAAAQKMVSNDGSLHSSDLFNFVLSVNVSGTFNLTRHALKELVQVEPENKDGERGVIIMVSSAAAFEGQPGQVAYAASKGAIRSMTLPLARDLGRYGIRVNTIAPSLFTSPMAERMSEKVRKNLIQDVVFPKRFGEAEEFAEMVKFIIENGTYLNGETYRLTAGSRLSGRL